jgi:hypothetical protein
LPLSQANLLRKTKFFRGRVCCEVDLCTSIDNRSIVIDPDRYAVKIVKNRFFHDNIAPDRFIDR